MPSTSRSPIVLICSSHSAYVKVYLLTYVEWMRNQQNIHILHLQIVDAIYKLDHWAIDTQMVNPQDHLLMSTDDSMLQ